MLLWMPRRSRMRSRSRTSRRCRTRCWRRTWRSLWCRTWCLLRTSSRLRPLRRCSTLNRLRPLCLLLWPLSGLRTSRRLLRARLLFGTCSRLRMSLIALRLHRSRTLRFYAPLGLTPPLRRRSRTLLRLHITLLNLRTALLFLPHSRRSFRDTSSPSRHSSRPRKGSLRRTTMVRTVKLRPIVRSFRTHLRLRRNWSHARLPHSNQLGRTRPNVYATPPAVVADAILNTTSISHVVINHSTAVNVGTMEVNVSHGAVVVEVVTVPIAAKIAGSDITEPVINTAIKADMKAPVPMVEPIPATIETPVRRSPESAIVRRRAPDSGNPVVATSTPTPVTGRPDVVRFGSRRLIIIRQLRGWFARVLRDILTVVLIGIIRGSLRIALFHRCRSLLITFALLLRRISGALAENLSRLAAIHRR